MADPRRAHPEYFQQLQAVTKNLNDKRSAYVKKPYTKEQKDKAIQLLNKGLPAPKIAEQIGGPSCSHANPYRWRGEEDRKRERAAERQRQEEERRRQAEEWRRQQIGRNAQGGQNGDILFLIVLIVVYVSLLGYLVSLDEEKRGGRRRRRY